MPNAIETQGTVFAIGNEDSPLTYTTVGSITSFSGFDGQAAEIDVTNLASTAKEFLMGLQDNGNFSVDIFYDAGNSGQDKMRAAKASREIQDFKLTLSDTTAITFRGFVTSAPISGGVDNAVSGSFGVRISGAVTGL